MDYTVKIRKGVPVKVYSDGRVIAMTRKEVYETKDPYLIDKYEDMRMLAYGIMEASI